MVYGYCRVSTKGQAKDGNSIEAQEAAVREAGAEVLGIVSIVTYGMQKATDRLQANNVKNVSLTDFDTIAKAAAEEGYIANADIDRVIAFRNNPSDESWMNK